MDRHAHEYAAAMAFAQQQQQQASIQQQQQYGFHPQSQQFPQQAHAPPFLPPHPSLQQFPYHRHLPQQQPLYPHHHLPLLHLQQQQPAPAFAPHLPPHPMSHSPFMHPFDSAPPPAAPPSDPELHKRIDKLVEYSVKNGPEFEAMIREKQQDNPAYSFLFGAEGHSYYRYKLWLTARASSSAFNPSFPSSSMPIMPSSHSPILNASPVNPHPLGAVPGAPPSLLASSQLHQPSFPPFYDQHQHSQPLLGQTRAEYEPLTKTFKGLSGPLPSDVSAELNSVLNNLTGTKESIKGAKMWFMQRSPFAPALAEAFRERIFALDESERQLHIIFLANDILFDSLQRRMNPQNLDNEALAFRPVLGSMLARVYSNPQNKEENQTRLEKILGFWASKEVYDKDTITSLEKEMISGPPPMRTAAQIQAPAMTDTSSLTGLQWHSDAQISVVAGPHDEEGEKQPTLASAPPQFLTSGIYLPTGSPAVMADRPPPPYPLFPPGLIPGMVRKMQIGSGVPYSPMSPLDIPTAIPPSVVPPSEILVRVSKFFKEIGEVNPSEGPMKGGSESDEEYERKGGACIPPPPNMHRAVDPETGMYPDGSVDRKPGSSESGRLGIGATADPNEATQYDDVYSSYRKQRSTNYHTSMSARSVVK